MGMGWLDASVPASDQTCLESLKTFERLKYTMILAITLCAMSSC